MYGMNLVNVSPFSLRLGLLSYHNYAISIGSGQNSVQTLAMTCAPCLIYMYHLFDYNFES